MAISAPIQDIPFFCSWSGGKDSCLALYHAIRQGGIPRFLLTMMEEGGLKSRSHGLPKALIQAQAESLGIPVVFRSASWDQYEAEFLSALRGFRDQGLRTGVFGDIDVEAHLEWVRGVCGRADIQALHPLWQQDRAGLLKEFIGLGFQAIVVALKEDSLGKGFLGRPLDEALIRNLQGAGVDASGELGEYHTLVTAGPLFSFTVPLEVKGEDRHDGYRFLDLGTGPFLRSSGSA